MGVGVKRFFDYVTLSKPRITAMSVLTALAGYALAPGAVAWDVFVRLALGTALVVGAANALNMVWERQIDGRMARTRNRPLPQGRLGAWEAYALGVTLGVASVPVLWSVSPLAALLGEGALALYVLCYTPMKPASHLATWVGAIPGAAPMLMGWSAADGVIDARAIAVFAVLFIWQMPHFWAISLFRQEEYAAAGLQTLPGQKGLRATEIQIPIMLFVQVAASFVLPVLGVVGWVYAGIAAAAGAMVLASAFRGDRDAHAWGRHVFFRSLVYLPVVCLAMLIDKRL